MNLLVQIDHGLLLASLIACALLGLTFFWLLATHLLRRKSALDREARLLATPLPKELPQLLLQLPTFNEGRLIRRLAARVEALSWPRNRLQVQILDDSTDGSLVHAEAAAASLRDAGVDAVVLHRTDRAGYKAGALGHGLMHSCAEYVAILDADYLPEPAFLEKCMRPFLADATLALVQARCDYLNGGENLITATQQRLLDAHYAIEQPARNWAGHVMPFNGTCGIWRRAALDQAGDWQGDTLAEDMDVSYRAQLNGWHALFLWTVAVPGELPRGFDDWRRQQFRWTKGSAQVTRKLLPAVWRAPIRFDAKLGATFHLGLGAFGPLLLVAFASAGLEIGLTGALTPGVRLLAVLVAGEMILGPALLQLAGQVMARRAKMIRELAHLPITLGLQLLVGLANLGGSIEALAGRPSAFIRTAKHGAAMDEA